MTQTGGGAGRVGSRERRHRGWSQGARRHGVTCVRNRGASRTSGCTLVGQRGPRVVTGPLVA
jgi:hypothetical protein